MDREAGYAAAHEHASTGRYREAQEILEQVLHEEPSHVQALILLGKVEYYLRHATRSRRCFETALVYDPANIAAFFGIEHYRGRRRTVWFAGCAIVLAALLAGVAAVAARRSVAVLREASTQVRATIDGLSRSVQEVTQALEGAAGAVADVRRAVDEEARDSRSRLGEISSELARVRRETETLARRIDEVRRVVERPQGDQGAQ